MPVLSLFMTLSKLPLLRLLGAVSLFVPGAGGWVRFGTVLIPEAVEGRRRASPTSRAVPLPPFVTICYVKARNS